MRNLLAGALSWVPLAMLEQVRVLHASSTDGAAIGRLTSLLLKFIRYRQIDPFVNSVHPADRPDIRLVNVDSVIVRRIYWLGQQGYEGALSRCWERSCTQANEILEIGANSGFYTVLGSKAAGKSTPYTAVEPHPVTHRILRRNVDYLRGD